MMLINIIRWMTKFMTPSFYNVECKMEYAHRDLTSSLDSQVNFYKNGKGPCSRYEVCGMPIE